MQHPILLASLCVFACGSSSYHGAVLSAGSKRNLRWWQDGRGQSEQKVKHGPLVEVTLRSPNGMQYIGDITIGGQTLSALYDTGSFDVITVGNICGSCRVPPKLALYSNASSGTFKKGQRSVKGHVFAGGVVWARQDFETVHVGATDPVLSADHMPFWQVVHTDMRLWTRNDSRFTTYVGLGHTSHVPMVPKNEEPMKSLLEVTDTQRFSWCLKGNDGRLVFNPTVDTKASTFMFKSVPVIGHIHWAVEMNSVTYSLGGSEQRACGVYRHCAAIIDSGTSLIAFPPRQFDFIQKLSKKLKDDCSNLDEMPDLVIDLGGQQLALPPSAYVIRASFADNYCYPAFMDVGASSADQDVWILGIPFLRHFYTVFDRNGPSIHFSEKNDKCEPVPTAPTASASFLRPAGLNGTRRGLQPAIADVRQASGPSWVFDEKHLIL